jgi:predicted metal-dependent phosphoesterase TrpH
MLKIDLHTHSIASPDGGISEQQYGELLERQIIDYIAITDHNRIDFAKKMQKKFGQKIIVGEEILTDEGELVGLFLKEQISPGLTPLETAQQIRAQGGVVYVPHPFETIRKGLTADTMHSIADYIDIVESHNGRAFMQNRTQTAIKWAQDNSKASVASSDAHGISGVGYAYTLLENPPNANTLLREIKSGKIHWSRPPLHTLLYPKINRLKKGLGTKHV